MLLLPPRHGKSTIASMRYPAYALGLNPLQDIISASATFELAEDFGREVRNCIAGSECRALFPELTLAEDSQAKGKWRTQAGGGYYSVGIGGTIMGRGGSRAIIDDPFKSWEDAQSELARRTVWEWYQGTLYNRLTPNAAIVLIQHRMHEADLAGRLIEHQKEGGDRWEIVEMPAIGEDGPLWPERFDLPALDRIRANSHPLAWSSLYQQNPLPDEGIFFKREWFEFFDPKKLAPCHKYMSGDFAVTDGGGDYTEIATHGYLGNVLYLAVEGWYGRTAPDAWIERLIDQAARWQPFAFFGEKGVIRNALEGFILRRMRERVKYVALEWLARPHDKPTMARSLQGLAAMGKVKIADTAYGHRLLAQLIQFPAAQLDDAVDMATLMGLAIDQQCSSIIKVPEKRDPVPPNHVRIQELVDKFEARDREIKRI